MKLIFILLLLCYLNNAERVLVLYVHEETSHILSMAPFLNKLADERHDLTILNSGNNKKPIDLGFKSNIIHIYLETQPSVAEFISYILWRYDPHAAMMALVQHNGDVEMDRLLQYAPEKIAVLLNGNYDLVIVDEIFSVHGMTIARMLKELECIPYIIFTTSNIGPESNTADLAMAHTPALDATHGTFLPTGPDDSFKSGEFYYRLYNVLEAIWEMSSFWYIGEI